MKGLIDEVNSWLSAVRGIEKRLLSIISLAGSLSTAADDPARRQKFKEMAAPARVKLGKLEEYKHQLENIVEECKQAKTQEDYNHSMAEKLKIQKEIEETKAWAEKLERFLQEELSSQKESEPASRPKLRYSRN